MSIKKIVRTFRRATPSLPDARQATPKLPGGSLPLPSLRSWQLLHPSPDINSPLLAVLSMCIVVVFEDLAVPVVLSQRTNKLRGESGELLSESMAPYPLDLFL